MKGRAGRPHCKLTRKYLAAGLSLPDAQLAANRERSRGYYHKSPHPFSLWRRRSEDRREKHRKHMQDMRQKQRDGKLLYEAKQLWLIPPPQGGW